MQEKGPNQWTPEEMDENLRREKEGDHEIEPEDEKVDAEVLPDYVKDDEDKEVG